jgi:hypothetical protein
VFPLSRAPTLSGDRNKKRCCTASAAHCFHPWWSYGARAAAAFVYPSCAALHASVLLLIICGRSFAVMANQAKDLQRLNALVLGLGLLLLAVSASGYVVLNIYLLSNIAPTRLAFLGRTMNYLQTGIKANMALRDFHLMALNMSGPWTVEDEGNVRSTLSKLSESMSTMHTLNYVSSPSARVSDFFQIKTLVETVAVPGTGSYQAVLVNFWELVNDFITAIQSASAISIEDLTDPEYVVNRMGLNKRSLAFM